jgi:hypothetical protein
MKAYFDHEKLNVFGRVEARCGFHRVARASRVLVPASRRNNLPQRERSSQNGEHGGKVRDREDAITCTRDACATQNKSPREEADSSSSFEQEQEQEKE